MASRCQIDTMITVVDASGIHQEQREHFAFAVGVTPNGKREPVTLTASTFTALSPPTGTKGLIIILNGATGLAIKGVTGDTGFPIAPTSNPITGFDFWTPLGAAPSIGIASSNTSNQVIECLWL